MSAADTFDLWLEGRLRHDLVPLTAVQPPAARYKTSQPGVWSLKLTLATAAALTALVLSGIGAFAATATGSLDPRVWGDQLRDCSQLLGQSGGSVRECFSDLSHGRVKSGHGALPTAPRAGERDDKESGPASLPPGTSQPGQDSSSGAPGTNPPPAEEGGDGGSDSSSAGGGSRSGDGKDRGGGDDHEKGDKGDKGGKDKGRGGKDGKDRKDGKGGKD